MTLHDLAERLEADESRLLRCPGCRVWKQAREYWRNAGRNNGRHWRCIECAKALTQWTPRTPEQVAKRAKTNRRTTKRHYKANRAEILARIKAYYQANAERIKAQARARYARNRS